MIENAWKNPEAFSAELHFALLSQGLRGPLLRRLMRVARPDPELSRIFEAKVGEFRRYVRESRQRTIWNLPLRGWEWLSDQARFTPPREVLMTLVYVVLAMMAVEFFKSRVVSPADPHALQAAALPLRVGEPAAYRGPVKPDRMQLDQQMITELERLGRSPAWREAIAAQLVESLTVVDMEPLLRKKLEAVLASPDFAERVAWRPHQFSAQSQPAEADPQVPAVLSEKGDTP